MGCFAHTMNLMVQSALTLEEDLINKTKNIVSHFRKSTVANNSFKTYQLNNGIKNPKKLIQDISTRWNSTYYMVCRFVELETSIRGTLGLLNNAPENLRPEEWTILKDLIKVLRPFEESTKAISGQKYMTASLVIVIVQGLFKVYNNLRKTNLAPRVLHVVDKLIANMNERDGFKNLEKKKTANIIRSKYTEEYESVSLADVNTPPNSEPSIWDDIDSCVAKSTPIGTATSRAIVELQRYMEDSIISRHQDPLKWWKDHSYNYPNLSI
ncbi:zinc finger BED domain-containing protein 4-like [Acyrthosiphon pisum]|uniref:HAT C-terminal dimerisation domain-containing protein n=1 Tax=Acyrthosiphon pisum TaxID=7029 RepID=A0A8R2FAI7_ACYPI|nr:zinc finger BED domain-containing protein 4-like [Acyrthosiphon pisum]|eukprot:XP_008186193.1 PREDICTED: zinc finger BED domain-containing protein 4-like [Acyrthosiphon pisum]